MGVSDDDLLMLDSANRIEKLEAALERIRDFQFGWRGTNAHDDVAKLQQIAREALE
jgi:hypothetical protein